MDELLDFIEIRYPFRWLLSFDGDREITLEHFDDSYLGDLESGSGTWSRSGKLEDVLTEAKRDFPD